MTQMIDRSETQPGGVQPARSAAPPQAGRLTVFLHSLAFVLGFGILFTLTGAAFGLFGRSLYEFEEALRRIGAVLLLIFALVTLGVIQRLAEWISARTDVSANPAAAALVSVLNFFPALLYTERRVTEMHSVSRGWGYLSSALLGVSFAAGWVPCIGPILSSIFVLAMSSATVGQGAALLAIYSLGLGIPFLLTGAAFDRMSGFLRRLNRHANVVSIISGVFLLLVAWLLWTDRLGMLTNQFSALNDAVLAVEDRVTGLFGGGISLSATVLASAPLAFTAGLISFFSPCVLPLVPAYIGYLSGTALGAGSRRP